MPRQVGLRKWVHAWSCAALLLVAHGLLPSKAMANDGNPNVEEAILEHYDEWRGTRHKLGGTSHAGVDCSSFIQKLYEKHFGIELPRSSREQMQLGTTVDKSNLRTGDLLFFRTGPTLKHVAVYIGNNRFLHVSTRRGVMLSDLDESYWRKRFLKAQRLM